MKKAVLIIALLVGFVGYQQTAPAEPQVVASSSELDQVSKTFSEIQSKESFLNKVGFVPIQDSIIGAFNIITKGNNKKTITIESSINIQTEGLVLLDYKILGNASQVTQGV